MLPASVNIVGWKSSHHEMDAKNPVRRCSRGYHNFMLKHWSGAIRQH